MPGTDICLKIGGYVRAETTYHSNGNFTGGPTSGEVFERQSSEFVMRARAYITADAREQTAWGTARAYVAVGVATTDTGATLVPSILGFNRAFIQWAGITAGVAQSFYEFYEGFTVGYRAYLPSSGTGDTGWWVWAYTAQLGNGLAASISAEQRRVSQIIGINDTGVFTAATGFSNGSITTTGGPPVALPSATPGYGGLQVPDIVGNIRLDQTWGSAQIMAAAHEVNAQYFNEIAGNTNQFLGHPGDKWGWVVGAGLRLNFPMVAQGDFFQTQMNYTQGAVRYLAQADNASNFQIERGNTYGFGVMSDCVWATVTDAPTAIGTGCQLTTAWSVNASYEHYWTPQFHESFIGGYLAVRYNALANANLCGAELGGADTAGLVSGPGAVAPAGCNNNFDLWSAATRLQYDFTKTLYLGVEFLYQHLDTAQLPGNTVAVPAAVAPAGNGLTPFNQVKDQNVLSVTLRMHKDFLP